MNANHHAPVIAACMEPELKGDKCNHSYEKKISVYLESLNPASFKSAYHATLSRSVLTQECVSIELTLWF